MEDKTVEDTGETEIYYKFNKVFQNTLITAEIAYCVICMGIFLFVIYWNQEEKSAVILGKDNDFSSDDETFDDTYQDRLDAHFREKERARQAKMLDRLIGSNMNNSAIEDSVLSNYRTFSSNSKLYGKMRGNTRNEVSGVSQGEASRLQELDERIHRSYVDYMHRDDQTMRYDSVYRGPNRSTHMKKVGGYV